MPVLAAGYSGRGTVYSRTLRGLPGRVSCCAERSWSVRYKVLTRTSRTENRTGLEQIYEMQELNFRAGERSRELPYLYGEHRRRAGAWPGLSS